MKRAILVHNPAAGAGKYPAETLIEWLAEAGFKAPPPRRQEQEARRLAPGGAGIPDSAR